jgi:hypothetical protein
VPVAAVSPENAGDHFGFLAGFIGIDCPASSATPENSCASRVPLRRGTVRLDPQTCLDAGALEPKPSRSQQAVTIDGNHVTGESYTIAHHVFTEDGDRKIMIASLRYLDTFSKLDGSWYFAERKLIVDWSETRSMTDH